MKGRFLIIYALILAIGLFTHCWATLDVPVSRSLGDFPPDLGHWSMAGSTVFSQEILDVLKPSDYLDRRYVNPEGVGINVYVGYHSGGPGVGAIHSPKNCLPGSGWFEMSSEPVVLKLPDRTIHAVYSLYRKGATEMAFVYWFELDGYTVDDEYKLKLAEIANSITKRRKDSAFLRFTLPVTGDRDQALKALEDFIAVFDPVIHEFLPFGKG